LQANFPNPFNPQTTIRYTLGQNRKVELTIFDCSGKKIKTLVNAYQRAGEHQVHWNGLTDQGRRASSGVYVYRLQAGDKQLSGKMVLMK